MKKLVIIPAYNEGGQHREYGCRIFWIMRRGFDYVVINDCSKDRTLQRCRENGLNVIDLPVNLGIGGGSPDRLPLCGGARL